MNLVGTKGFEKQIKKRCNKQRFNVSNTDSKRIDIVSLN